MTRNCTFSQMLLAGLVFLCCGGRGVAQTLEPSDIVVAAELPLYPQLAITARIDGTVIAIIKVSKGVVTEADIVSGPVIFASSVKRNLLTWRFDANVKGTRQVMYVFELSKTVALGAENPVIELRLPSFVKLTAKPVRPVTLETKGHETPNP